MVGIEIDSYPKDILVLLSAVRSLLRYLVANCHTDAPSHQHHHYQHHCHHHCQITIIIIALIRTLGESHGHCWEGICVCLIDESVIIQQHTYSNSNT